MFLFNSKFVIATKNEFWGVFLSLAVKIKTLRHPTNDVTCISPIIKNGGGYQYFKNQARYEKSVKSFIDIILNVHSNKVIKNVVAIVL